MRSAKAAFEATDDELQRAAGLARHARIELLSRRIDAAMDEAVEAASLLDPGLPPGRLLVDTLTTLAGVLADLELMPLALDYQRRAHEAAAAAAAEPAVLGPDDGPAEVLVATAATRLGELCAELGEGLLEDGAAEDAAPHFAEARSLAEQALELLPPGRRRAWSPPRWCTAGRWSGWARPPRPPARCAPPSAGAARSATALCWPRRSWRWAAPCAGRANSRAADDHLTQTLALATEHGLPGCAGPRCASCARCTRSSTTPAGRCPTCRPTSPTSSTGSTSARTRWVELFGRRKSLLETERAAGQLRRQAYEDTLTHLPNRRYAEARLDGLLTAGAAPALAVVDVDRFKSINDAIGHPGGDAVLRRIGELLVAGVRDSDEVCRWAGDEFVILFPETTAEQAERALERIRRRGRRLRLGVPRPHHAGHDQRGHRLGRARRRPAHAVRRRRRRALRREAQRPGPRGPALGGHPDPGRRRPRRGRPDGRARLRRRTPAPGAPRPGGGGLRGATRVRRAAGGAAAPRAADPPLWSGSAVDPPLGSGGSASLPRGRPRPRRAALAAAATPARSRRSCGRRVAAPTQVLAAVRQARDEDPDRTVVVLRAPADMLAALAAEHGGAATVDPDARAAAVGPRALAGGRVAVLCARGADAAVAAEAAFVAGVAGATVGAQRPWSAGCPTRPRSRAPAAPSSSPVPTRRWSARSRRGRPTLPVRRPAHLGRCRRFLRRARCAGGRAGRGRRRWSRPTTAARRGLFAARIAERLTGMYVPAHFAADDAAVRDLLARSRAADLVTPDGRGTGRHLPAVPARPRRRRARRAARPRGPQQRPLAAEPTGESLAIVRRPDAYVSPGWYPSKAEHGRAVPTWNYVTVHVHGRLVVHDEPGLARGRRPAAHDRRSRGRERRPWSVDDAPRPFVEGQLRAIVGRGAAR